MRLNKVHTLAILFVSQFMLACTECRDSDGIIECAINSGKSESNQSADLPDGSVNDVGFASDLAGDLSSMKTCTSSVRQMYVVKDLFFQGKDVTCTVDPNCVLSFVQSSPCNNCMPKPLGPMLIIKTDNISTGKVLRFRTGVSCPQMSINTIRIFAPVSSTDLTPRYLLAKLTKRSNLTSSYSEIDVSVEFQVSDTKMIIADIELNEGDFCSFVNPDISTNQPGSR